MSEFLTHEEIQALTGYTRKSEQRRSLQSMSIKFLVNPTGRPVVSRTVLLQRFGNASDGPCVPDLDALRKFVNG